MCHVLPSTSSLCLFSYTDFSLVTLFPVFLASYHLLLCSLFLHSFPSPVSTFIFSVQFVFKFDLNFSFGRVLCCVFTFLAALLTCPSLLLSVWQQEALHMYLLSGYDFNILKYHDNSTFMLSRQEGRGKREQLSLFVTVLVHTLTELYFIYDNTLNLITQGHFRNKVKDCLGKTAFNAGALNIYDVSL